MPRGGKRQRQPGKQYPNRSDMRAQPVRTAPSKTYGDGVASARAQQVIPLPQAPQPQVGPGAATGMPAPPGPLPGELPLARPTERPGEPLTAGMAIGPGAGPSPNALAINPVIETLRAAYRAFPNEGVGALLEAAERSLGSR